MFHFPRFAPYARRKVPANAGGFPHSEISGSKATNRLPEAYRKCITSFFAVTSLGIHRAPFMFPVRKPEHHITISVILHFVLPVPSALLQRDVVCVIRMSKSPRASLNEKTASRRFLLRAEKAREVIRFVFGRSSSSYTRSGKCIRRSTACQPFPSRAYFLGILGTVCGIV